METAKLYARGVARIEPDWIEPLARGLTQSDYTDPRWDRKLAQVVAWERVSLYGLTIVPKRRVHYGAINPQEAREIFIREALANREFDTRAPFLRRIANSLPRLKSWNIKHGGRMCWWMNMCCLRFTMRGFRRTL